MRNPFDIFVKFADGGEAADALIDIYSHEKVWYLHTYSHEKVCSIEKVELISIFNCLKIKDMYCHKEEVSQTEHYAVKIKHRVVPVVQRCQCCLIRGKAR